jgi:spore germination protein YaaH
MHRTVFVRENRSHHIWNARPGGARNTIDIIESVQCQGVGQYVRTLSNRTGSVMLNFSYSNSSSIDIEENKDADRRDDQYCNGTNMLHI